MGLAAKRINPKLWRRIKAKTTRAAKGGRGGQWPAWKHPSANEYERGSGMDGDRHDEDDAGYTPPRSRHRPSPDFLVRPVPFDWIHK